MDALWRFTYKKEFFKSPNMNSLTQIFDIKLKNPEIGIKKRK